ncbi:MAG: FecR family protein [Gemmataceae bacterium]
MNDADFPHDESDIGEENIEQLLKFAYDPCDVDDDFVERVRERMLHVASRRARRERRARLNRDPHLGRLRQTIGWVMASAAAVTLFVLGVISWSVFHGQFELARQQTNSTNPRSPLAVGQTLRTEAGQRLCGVLTDGSALYVNQHTILTVLDSRQLRLEQGEIFVAVAARPEAVPFTVVTPQRTVTAVGTSFVVLVDDRGTGVAVTQGQVRISDLAEPLHSRQLLPPGGNEVISDPRVSDPPAWVHELMTSADVSQLPAGYCYELINRSAPVSAPPCCCDLPTRPLAARAASPSP